MGFLEWCARVYVVTTWAIVVLIPIVGIIFLAGMAAMFLTHVRLG